jgi:hypothetical protein
MRPLLVKDVRLALPAAFAAVTLFQPASAADVVSIWDA